MGMKIYKYKIFRYGAYGDLKILVININLST